MKHYQQVVRYKLSFLTAGNGHDTVYSVLSLGTVLGSIHHFHIDHNVPCFA